MAPSFSISAGGASFSVSLEGNRLIRDDVGAFSLRKRRIEIPVEAIEGYFIEPGRAPTFLIPWDSSFVVAWRAEVGRRCERIPVLRQDPNVARLLEELERLRPDASLLGLPPADARKKLGLRSERTTLWLFAAVILLLSGAGVFALGRYNAAAVHIRDDDPILSQNQGTALSALGRYDEAVAAFDRAIARGDRSAETRSRRGLALSAQGRWKDALPDFEEAARMEPGNADYLFYLALALGNLDRPAEALELLDRAIAVGPDNAKMHAFRATALYGVGRRDEAIVEMRRTLIMNPSEPLALKLQAIIDGQVR